MNDYNHLPKYLQLKKEIEDLIDRGKLPADNRLPTENELANKYDVSRHTVRKALGLLKQEGLLYKKQGVGTFYSQRNTTATRLIGFLSMSLYDYIFMDILNGVDSVLHDSGYQILLGNSRDSHSREREILESFLKRDVDGLILDPARGAYNYPHLALLHRFSSRNIPVVILDSRFADDSLNYVTVNDVKGGYLATQHLIAKGHSKIGIIYKAMHGPAVKRFQGYKQALEEAGLPLYNDYVKAYYSSEFGDPENFNQEIYQLTQELVDSRYRPTAVFCFNDQIAILVNEIFKEMDYSVPGDISLIGYDDSRLVQLQDVSITSVSHPKKKAGETAGRIIMDRIQNKDIGAGIVYTFEPELVERSSVITLTGVN